MIWKSKIMCENNNKADFPIDDNLWLVKQYMKKAKQLKGRFYFYFNCYDDIGSVAFEFTNETEIRISDDLLYLSNDEGDHHLYRIKNLVHIKRELDTNVNV